MTIQFSWYSLSLYWSNWAIHFRLRRCGGWLCNHSRKSSYARPKTGRPTEEIYSLGRILIFEIDPLPNDVTLNKFFKSTCELSFSPSISTMHLVNVIVFVSVTTLFRILNTYGNFCIRFPKNFEFCAQQHFHLFHDSLRLHPTLRVPLSWLLAGLLQNFSPPSSVYSSPRFGHQTQLYSTSYIWCFLLLR